MGTIGAGGRLDHPIPDRLFPIVIAFGVELAGVNRARVDEGEPVHANE